MKTTALFVELIVIGATACIWIVLFLVKDLDKSQFYQLFCFIAGNKYIVTAVAIPIVYTIGILIDKLAKGILEFFNLACEKSFSYGNNQRVGKEKYRNQRRPFLSDRLIFQEEAEKYADIIMTNGDPMSDILLGRSKVRIIRALVFNVPLIMVCAIIFMNCKLQNAIDIPSHIIDVSDIFSWGIIIWGVSIGMYCYIIYLFKNRLNTFHKSWYLNFERMCTDEKVTKF